MQLKIPGSKSISNRALLLAALAQGTSVLHNLQISADILAMIDALRALGVSIELNQQSQTARILGCNGNFPHRAAQINCYESGTLARFMLVLCSGVAGIYHLDGASSLRKRPLSTQLKTLEQMGVNYSSDRLPLTIESTEVLAGGEIYADGSQTSQHISALLMMAPFMKQSLILKAENSVSRPYIEMTCKMMQEFGVEVVSDPEGWCVFLPQYYQSREYEIESDWSTAAYLLSAAALTSS
ncbi:MAG TPA: 3-phosphoshikimate 1-carboxyvinyltransferase, partial [Gammaproteobacteria bacterium]|nr:3-phosphoshikimate 1-carboxyvinyltransferase [Gammaproteobacteria bacterium]